MASAIISGIKCNSYEIFGSEYNEEISTIASQRLGIEVFCDNQKLAELCDIIFISTKPNQVSEVLKQIKEFLTPEKLVVSIAAGVTTSKIESILTNSRVVRVMPNTPALVKLGMFGICAGKQAYAQDIDYISDMLSSIGRCITVEESQMDIVTAISGSGPAFFYKVINIFKVI